MYIYTYTNKHIYYIYIMQLYSMSKYDIDRLTMKFEEHIHTEKYFKLFSRPTKNLHQYDHMNKNASQRTHWK